MPGPYPPIPATIRSTFRWYDGTSLYGSRMFWLYGTPPASIANLATLATAIATNWHSNMGATVASAIALTEVDCEDLNARNGHIGNWQGTFSGSNAGYEPPANASLNVRFLIPDHYRGRIMALYSMTVVGLGPFGSLAAGALASRLGPRVTVALGGMLAIAAASTFALAQRRRPIAA